ncbi:hypothetical protein M2129_002208 [Polynucleobacter sphagniphilus]|uniref:hypothetical protein n=1 Tax=Polynucleobacter sphagniphilus TaxID=1743169 RepID=UPI0024751C9D|nr:hypothetical protein [Polynucleobacter sphagniphilus]MDH6250198.1 hypothetical protein [Polynucleobacter sphagniphilus]
MKKLIFLFFLTLMVTNSYGERLNLTCTITYSDGSGVSEKNYSFLTPPDSKSNVVLRDGKPVNSTTDYDGLTRYNEIKDLKISNYKITFTEVFLEKFKTPQEFKGKYYDTNGMKYVNEISRTSGKMTVEWYRVGMSSVTGSDPRPDVGKCETTKTKF